MCLRSGCYSESASRSAGAEEHDRDGSDVKVNVRVHRGGSMGIDVEEHYTCRPIDWVLKLR